MGIFTDAYKAKIAELQKLVQSNKKSPTGGTSILNKAFNNLKAASMGNTAAPKKGFNMSRAIRSGKNSYRDAHGNLIAINGKMTGAAWKYLANKYGRDYANRAAANMAAGNVYQKGKWRIDNGRGQDSSWNPQIAQEAISKRKDIIKDDAGRYMFIDPVSKLSTYFNLDAKNAAVNRQTLAALKAASKTKDDSALGRVVNAYVNSQAGAGKAAWDLSSFVPRIVYNSFTGKGPKNMGEVVSGLTAPAGAAGRLVLNTMGAVGAPLAALPEEYTKYRKVFDIGQWIGTTSTGYTPWDERNQGVQSADWIPDEYKEGAQNMVDGLNGAFAIVGTKGATGVGKAIGRGARTLGNRAVSASRNAVQRFKGRFNRNALPNVEVVRQTPAQYLGVRGHRAYSPLLMSVRPQTIKFKLPMTTRELMARSGTGEHAAVPTTVTRLESSVVPETRLVWRDVDASGDIIVRNAPRTPKAAMEAIKAAERVKAARAAKPANSARSFESDPALQLEVQQFARETSPYIDETPYVDPAVFEEPFSPISDAGEFFIPGFFKKGGKMLQKFKKGKKIKSSYVKNQPITRTWVNDGKDFVNLYNLNPRGRISGTSNWDLGRIAALADPNSTMLMEELGLNLNSTTLDILKAMLDYASRANLRFSNINDKNFVDNKWGNQTLSAWNLLLTYVNNLGNLSNYQATNPMPQRTYVPSITRSAWDYSRGVGNLGFNNYAGLVNFVKANANHGFARDLVNRFGAVDTWKQADIENALGVSGRYGRGFLGSGDFTDMINSMAKWAGENDAKYDNRFNTPKKKTSTFNALDLVRKANAIKLDKTMPKLSFAKQGAKLPSRNVVERFKASKSFRLGEG